MKNEKKQERTLKEFCKLFNLYLEDMEDSKLFLGPENDIVGMMNNNAIKITTLNEKITACYKEEENTGIIEYQITSINNTNNYSRIEGSIKTVPNEEPKVQVVVYDIDNKKVLKLITGTTDDYFYIKNYQTREVSCMLKSTPKTLDYLKHITKCKEEKVWNTYMEISLPKTGEDNIKYIYESYIPRQITKGCKKIITNKFIDFGLIAKEINPRMHEFLKESRTKLELSQINLFDQAIKTSLNNLDKNSLGSLFRINFASEQVKKEEQVKALYRISH